MCLETGPSLASGRKEVILAMAGLSEGKIERSWDPAVQADPVNRTCFSSAAVHVLTVYSSGLHSRCVHDSRLQ